MSCRVIIRNTMSKCTAIDEDTMSRERMFQASAAAMTK